MTTSNEFSELWATLSRKVLAPVLVDDGAIFQAHDILGNNIRWFAPKERPIWEAVIQCLAVNTPPTTEAVIARVNGSTPAGYIKTIASQFNDDDNRHLAYNSEQLKALGALAQVRGYGRELSGIEQIEDIAKAVDKITTDLGGILASVSGRDSSPESVSELAWQQVEDFKTNAGIPTGLGWFDDATGGLWRGMNYWIVGAYKSGKTTTMRNIVLTAASLNHPVGVFCAEGSREVFTLDCQAMLATSILMDKGLRGNQLRLGGLFIKRFYWQTGTLNKDELDAIHEAKEIWQGLPVYVWDTADGIRNLTTLRYLVKYGRVHHGITSYWADYSQLFGEGATIFDRQSNTALAVQDIAQSENVAVCMLSQQNEQQIRSSDSYSAGVKGGGDASAAADFMLIPKIDPDTPQLMEISLKFSRHTRTGKGQHFLAPSSGLIIDKWQ